MKFKFGIGMLLSLFILIGCSSGGSGGSGGNDRSGNNESFVNHCPNNPPQIILDNDNFDPDWLITLVAALDLDKSCIIELKGIVVNGHDLNERAGIMYSTVLNYYEVADRIPIGVVNDRPQRNTATDATGAAPKLDSRYKDTRVNIMEFPSDGMPDYARENADEVLCEILDTEGNENITYITGGHLTGLESFFETDKCQSIELTRAKISRFVFGTGYSKEKEGLPEMNFSQGDTSPTPASKAAINVFDTLNQLAPEIPIEFPSYHKWSFTGRPGDQYNSSHHIYSPMAFIYAVPRYGVWGDHKMGDSLAVYVGANIAQQNGLVTNKRQVCIELNRRNAIIKINSRNVGACNHWIYDATSNTNPGLSYLLNNAVQRKREN